MVYLGEKASGRDNNLNLIRAIAATAVLVSHAFPITLGPTASEPLVASTGHSLGGLSVYAFFAISGFLISMSFERTSSWLSFLTARFLRPLCSSPCPACLKPNLTHLLRDLSGPSFTK